MTRTIKSINIHHFFYHIIQTIGPFLGTFLGLARFIFGKKILYTRVTSRFSLETLLQQKMQMKRRGRKGGQIVSTSFS